MKKHIKRFLSLLMAICMVSGFGAAPAFAADMDASDNYPQETSDWTTIDMACAEEDEIDGMAAMLDAERASRIIVDSGVDIGVYQVFVYPAKNIPESGKVRYFESIKNTSTYTSPSQTRIVQINPTTTEDLLTKFKTANGGVSADTWIVQVTYNIYTDGKGSYGKRFDFEAIGDSLTTDKFSYTLNRITVNNYVTYTFFFHMPENTSSYYDIGVRGSFTFYNVETRKNLSIAAGVQVRMNSPF